MDLNSFSFRLSRVLLPVPVTGGLDRLSQRMISRLGLAALSLVLMGLASPVMGREPKPVAVYSRVLFLGNSITKHGPKADIDWSGNWGMAASAEDKDYVHLVTAGLTKVQGSAPEIRVKNIAGFERDAAAADVEALLKEELAFKPDLVILAIGENVPALKDAEKQQAFKTAVLKLMKRLKTGPGPETNLVVRSCFWANAAKDKVLREACAEAGGVFADISALAADETNYGRAERPYKHAGVANHPGDKGMRGIADGILKAIGTP